LVRQSLIAVHSYAEDHPDELIDFENTCISGLGLGLLASSAVSLSASRSDLPLAGADVVRLAFRLGIHVQGVSENLEVRDLSETPDTWAYIVHDVDPSAVQKALDGLQIKEQVPDTGKVFVSAISRTSITLSGPPARLKALFTKSEFFRVSKSIPLPVYGGLCHAPHVYGEKDTQKIVDSSVLLMPGTKAWPVIPIYSTSTGLPYPAKNALSLYSSVVSELLTHAICWDPVMRGIVDNVKMNCASAATLYCFGNCIPFHDLNIALKASMPTLKTSVKNFVPWAFQAEPTDSTPRGTAQAKLAIVGMSCRLPGGATTTEKFWEVLKNGLDVSQRIPADRFDIDTHFDPTGKDVNKSMTEYGCFIDEPGMFDAPFFNMSPREAQVVDPQMRLALVTAYEALERAGYVGNRTDRTRLERIGTWYGQAADDYREVNQGQEVSTYYIPGGCRAFGPGRINYFFKFAGPSYSVDTACSSGLAAIEVACQALWNGEVDMAVAGGLNVLTNPDGFAGLCNGHFLTKGHNACKTWDATADGYCRADGIGSVVVKRLEDAEADNDNILGVILGTGTNHSADAVSITHPHAGHQAYLARQVLRQAGVDPLDVSYVELHGTGTQAGDYEEMQGIVDVYAPIAKGRRSKDQQLHIGAVKSNIGHSESAAGTTALIKVLLMLQKNAIPPHIGIKTEMNPRLPDLEKRNLHIAFKEKGWSRGAQGKKRIAAINNFGAAGGNTTMLIEEAPDRVITEMDPRQTHIITVSAKTKISLVGNIERMIAYLEANDDVSLADLSYTTTARRYHHCFRIAIAASDVTQLKKQLKARLEKVDSLKSVGKTGSSPPIAFTFTGQGASYKSMNLELYRDSPVFHEHIVHLDSLARGQGFPSFISALDGSHDKDYAHPPVVTQLALVCTEIALAKYWASLGVKPDIVMGHSLGEYAAMHVAGVITANEAIFIVGRRAQMLQEKCKIGSHTMMAVRGSLAQISESSAGNPYTIACVNGPVDTVLSGTQAQMDEVAVSLQAAGLRCIKLDVAFAFHSEQTDPILDDFEAVARSGVLFQEPKLPVISPLLGKVIFDGKTLSANYVRRSTREAVDFLSALESAQQIGAINEETVWVEIGPHPVCTGFVKSTIENFALAVPSLRRDDDSWKTMAESMAALHLTGLPVDWNEFHRAFEKRLRLLDLPTYAFNEKNHWLPYKGTWCLTKGNEFYGSQAEVGGAAVATPALPRSEISTSTVQQIIEQTFDGAAGSVTMQSDLMQPDLFAAANGHRMNDCGVVTSVSTVLVFLSIYLSIIRANKLHLQSIHADIAYTLGEYLHRKLSPKSKKPSINVANLEVTKGLVAQSHTKTPQLMRVTIATDDIASSVADITWQNVDKDGNTHDTFATATVFYGDATEWLSTWSPIEHLVQGRIEALERMAVEGIASRFTRKMAYTLFASNLVDYAEKYRGMKSVVVHELEAFADIELTLKESGVWTVAPYFIDSVAHLAGFVMNCSDAIDTQKDYCVTPGWASMRFAKPLVAGQKYRSYVKMIPTKDEPSVYVGDVYIMQDGEIVGMVGGIQFRRFPRILLSRFFSPPDKQAASETVSKATAILTPAAAPRAAIKQQPTPDLPVNLPAATPTPSAKPAEEEKAAAAPVQEAPPAAATNSVTTRALALIAKEAALELSDLEDEVEFANLGIDSLMSLVISEKLKSELDVKVGGSLFLDYPTIGDLRVWLDECYS
jgi:monodictyphenone polyketide synthase